MDIEQRLRELGIELPVPPNPKGSYVSLRWSKQLLFTSGTSCYFVNGQPVFQGKLGKDLTIKQGQEAARQAALTQLAIIRQELGNLNRIAKIIKLLGIVSSAEDFYEQPQVINGASQVLEEILGDKGKHARSAIGTNVLPFNIPLEIELIVEVLE